LSNPASKKLTESQAFDEHSRMQAQLVDRRYQLVSEHNILTTGDEAGGTMLSLSIPVSKDQAYQAQQVNSFMPPTRASQGLKPKQMGRGQDGHPAREDSQYYETA
jgi:hypothetical protein